MNPFFLVWREMFKKNKNIWIIVLIFVATAIVADVVLNYFSIRQYRNDQTVSVTLELATARARLEERIGNSLSLIYGMGAHISIRPDLRQDEFNALAHALMKHGSSLKNMAAAPDFVIQYVYPLEGNRKIIGLDYRKVPDQWDRALAAKESGQMAIAGPLNLVQGGLGLIARVPIYRDRDGTFWGLVSSVIDLDVLMEQIEFEKIDRRIALAIRGKDGKGAQGDTFWGDPRLFDPDSQSVFMSVSLPTGSWQMAAQPENGWAKISPHHWLIHLFICLITTLGCMVAILRHKSRQALIESEKRLKAMSVASHDALIMIDSEDTITFWNRSAEVMFGYRDAEVIGKKLHEIIVLPDDKQYAEVGLRHFAGSGDGPVIGNTSEVVAIRKSGERFPVERSVAAFHLKDQWYAVGSVRDITERKEAEKELKRLATTDGLTGLFNRRYFMELAEKQLKLAIRYEKPFSLLMFDLDHFKSINDTYGHDVGDDVLRNVAKTMSDTLRSTDIFGRIGGEEFAVAMPETDRATAVDVAERLRIRFMETLVQTKAGPVRYTASMGITPLSDPQTLLSQMVKRADIALYQAKNNGRNRIEVNLDP